MLGQGIHEEGDRANFADLTQGSRGVVSGKGGERPIEGDRHQRIEAAGLHRLGRGPR